jgi:hypothetical protein
MLVRPITVVLLAICLALSACGLTSSPGADSEDTVALDAESAIEVPDVSGADGAQAVSDIEDAGLEPSLADANEDPGFDTARDATDCEVTDQDPVGGESASEGDEVTITVDCAQVDWSNREGAQWAAFDESYTSAFDDGCRELFDQSRNGSFYEDDYEYTLVDCQNENPGDASDASDVPTDVPDDPEGSGSDLGELDGCQALFENHGVVSLNYGADSITEDDCPMGAARSAAAPAHKSQTPKGPSAGYVKCDANIAARASTTSCAFAQDVFYEFWSNRPATTFRAYSPATHESYDVRCSVRAGQVACATRDGSAVTFSEAAVDAYTQEQADKYAATHDVGP